MVETVRRTAAYLLIDSLNAIEGDLVRIRFVETLLALLVFSIIAVGALTACGSSSTPSKATTTTTTAAARATATAACSDIDSRTRPQRVALRDAARGSLRAADLQALIG